MADDIVRQILDASVRLIEERGLASFSMREVARRTGVSHQAPYHHFPDRASILAALVAEGFVRLQAEMHRATALAKTPPERLSAVGEAYVAFARTAPVHFRLMFRSEHVDLAQHDLARQRADECFAYLVDVVGEAAKAAGGRNDSLPLVAWALAHGAATLILEGRLAKKMGPRFRSETAAVRAMMRAFANLVSGED